jgi:hypothetical protein
MAISAVFIGLASPCGDCGIKWCGSCDSMRLMSSLCSGWPRHNRIGMPGALAERRLLQIEPEPCLAHLRVGPMATEAVAGQDRLHILIEVKPLRIVRCIRGSFPAAAARAQRQQGGRKRSPCCRSSKDLLRSRSSPGSPMRKTALGQQTMLQQESLQSEPSNQNP